MSSSKQHSLGQTSVEVLADVLDRSESCEQGVDAVYYRAQHENQLDLLDELERNGYLTKRDEKYLVTLSGLLTLRDPSDEELMARCCFGGIQL